MNKLNKKKLIDNRSRAKNSLLNKKIQFETTLTTPTLAQKSENEIMDYIAMRFRERTFDNYEFKEIKEKVEDEIYNYELCTENKELIELWDDIEISIDKLFYM